MRFEQLKYLETALRTGSFRQAAKELAIAQPTISTQVQRLEEDLGVVLLQRSAHGVRGTYAAERILPHVFAALNAEHALREEASAINGLTAGYIRLAAVTAASQALLPSVVQRLQADHPNIRFQVTEGGSEMVREGVAAGRFDGGLLVRFKTPPPQPGDLRYIDLLEGRLVLAIPENHPLASKPFISGPDLAHQPVIVFTIGSVLREAFEILTEGVDVKPVYYTENAETAQRMVRAGVGIAIGNTLAPSTISGDGVVLAPLTGEWTETRLSVVLRPDEQLSPAMQTFLHIVREERARLHRT
jgi:LysR family hydrogen peroxide-inducible transcriptional activator